jgi:hypothetical protein
VTYCLIQSCKPSSCQEWKPSLHRRECREGLVKYWQLKVSCLGELIGSQEQLYNFYSFTELLKIENKNSISTISSG